MLERRLLPGARLGELIDVAIRRPEVRPGLPGWLPSMDGAYEVGPSRFQALTGGFYVVDLETRNGPSLEVEVFSIGGPEDLNLAAIGKFEDDEVLLLMIYLQSHRLSIERDELRVVIRSDSQPAKTLDHFRPFHRHGLLSTFMGGSSMSRSGLSLRGLPFDGPLATSICNTAF
jgi:hypothetical protein